MARLDTLKTLLQISDDSHDSLLNALVSQCGQEYLRRTHQETEDDNIVDAMVVERFNRLGTEGAQSISYSGISESYESDYSAQTTALIRSKTRMVAL